VKGAGHLSGSKNNLSKAQSIHTAQIGKVNEKGGDYTGLELSLKRN